MREETHSAQTVLDLYLEFEAMQPDKRTWTPDKLRDNPPRLYRFQMLTSLFRAFDLGDLRKFSEGTFVRQRRIDDYAALIRQMESELKTVTKFRKGEDISLHEIAFLFTRLLEYRRRWDTLMHFSSGLLACSARYRYASFKVDEVNSQIRDRIAPINDILARIISPHQKVISKAELIAQFNYPDVDLLDINTDYL